MLGQLLEFSITASPVASALEFYRSLGFRELPVGDILSGPYAALWDGAITLGLQEREFDSPTPTFVRPDLKNYLRAFRRLGIELQFAELADDRFHEAGFLDPNGHKLGIHSSTLQARIQHGKREWGGIRHVVRLSREIEGTPGLAA